MTASERLINTYKKAYMQVLESITRKASKGTCILYERKMLQEIERIIKKLDKTAAGELSAIAKQHFGSKYSKAIASLDRAGITPLWGGVNERAVNAVIQNSVDNLILANRQFGRKAMDKIRSVTMDATANRFATGQSLRDMAKEIERLFAEEGMQTVVVGPTGKTRNYRLDTYAELVARSTTREAANTGTLEAAKQYDYDLVRFTEHYPTCDICAPIQGRVFSRSGRDKRFPYLFDVPGFKDGYMTIHPNCRHTYSITVERMWTEEERKKYLADAKKPLGKDSRTDAEKAAYDKGQEVKRKLRENRLQYERYKAVLGNDAPKTFQGFSSMKRKNSDKWQKIELDYRRRVKLINHPELALPNADNCIVEDAKFERYFFGGNNRDGLSKGVAFKSHSGYDINNWREMQSDIIGRAKLYPAVFREEKYGKLYYNQHVIIYGVKNNPMDVRLAWEVKGDTVRFITAFPD